MTRVAVHATPARRSGDRPAADLRMDLENHFATVFGRPLVIDRLGLFVEPAPGMRVHVDSFHPFGPPVPLQPA